MSFVKPTALGVVRGWLPSGWERFRHGFYQLLLAFEAVHRDAMAWKRYLRTCTIQAVVTLALGTVVLSTARHSSEGLREERVRRALQNVSVVQAQDSPSGEGTPAETEPAAPQRSRTSSKAKATRPAKVPRQSSPEEQEAKDSAAEAAQAKAEFKRKLSKLQKDLTDLSLKAGPTAVRRDRDFQEAREDLDEQLSGLEEEAADVALTADEKTTLLRLGAELDVLEQKTKPGFWDSAWALVLSIYGALSVAQAAVIALSRDYHAAIARDASLLLGVAPEDPPAVPRIRINVAWVRRKFKQRTRSMLVFLPGLALITLAALPLPKRALITSVLTTVWAAYWWVVWTASKSARAWERSALAPPPFFLRWWQARLAPLPFIGGLARVWAALWARLTRSVYSPAEAVEAQPAEFAGLATARALQLIPLLKLFVRPLVPVAAARLLAERAVRFDLRLGAGVPQAAALAAARAAVPASPGALAARDQM